MSFAVRCATKDDASALLDLRRAVFAETDFMLWEPQEFIATADDERKFISWFLSKTNSRLLVATDGTSLIGFLGVNGGERFRTKHSALVFSLYAGSSGPAASLRLCSKKQPPGHQPPSCSALN